jgi:hypothetical protein
VRKAVELTRNDDGTWTARIFSVCYTGTYEECVQWIRCNGEEWLRKAVDLTRNDDGTWTARIFSVCYTGTYEECVQWIRWNGEEW